MTQAPSRTPIHRLVDALVRTAWRPARTPRWLVPAVTFFMVVGLGGCRRAAAPPAPPRHGAQYETARPAPLRGPRALDRVTSLAVAGERVVAGTEPGLVILEPATGRVTLLAGDEHVSHAFVTDVAVVDGRVAWSSHRPPPGSAPMLPGAGGVRRVELDELRVESWHAGDGLGTDSVDCIAADERLVVACVGAGIAVRAGADRPAGEGSSAGAGSAEVRPAWTRELDGPSRPLTVVDPLRGPEATRSVIEFRPPGERMTAAAIAGRSVFVGTTHGLLVRRPDGLVRVRIPCRVGRSPAERVIAVAASSERAAVAVLGVADASGGFRAGGLVELESNDDGRWDARCHLPGVDVPRAQALDVAVAGDRIFLATHAGLTRIRGPVADLLDALSGAPGAAVTAVAAVDPAVAWIGTWGAGVGRVEEDAWVLWSAGDGLSPVARVTEGRLR